MPESGSPFIQSLMEKLHKYMAPEDCAHVYHAYEVSARAHAGRKRESGEPFITHPIATASILADMCMDRPTIMAALLHDVLEDEPITFEQLKDIFGIEVSNLVKGVTKLKEKAEEASKAPLEQVSGEADHLPRGWQISDLNLKNLLQATSYDVRVVLIKLADRLHNMRTLEYKQKESSRINKARETLFLYVPIATRLGIWWLKTELENLSLKTQYPQLAENLKKNLEKINQEQAAIFQSISPLLTEKLAQSGIHARLERVAPQVYELYSRAKMQGRPAEQIRMPLVVCIIAQTVEDCYTAVKGVHELWQYIPGSFDDYIFTPKEKYYRSLHTTVVGPGGLPLKARFRSHQMHEEAQFGVFAYWRFAEGMKSFSRRASKDDWAGVIRPWSRQAQSPADFIKSLGSEVLLGRVQVFSPKGKVFSLPPNATPIDLAYAIHSDIGDTCCGARVNDHLVTLDTRLKNGDRVDIITVDNTVPQLHWLDPHLELANTAHARGQIKRWFRRKTPAEHMEIGRGALLKELDLLGITQFSGEYSLKKIARVFGLREEERLFEKIGSAHLLPHTIAETLLNREYHQKPIPGKVFEPISRPTKTWLEGGQVFGTGKYPSHLADCCRPRPGDPIIGLFLTSRNTARVLASEDLVMIHRADCPQGLRDAETYRTLQVTWEPNPPTTFTTNLAVIAIERSGLLQEISSILFHSQINILQIQATTDGEKRNASLQALLEVEKVSQLVCILHRVNHLRNVIHVQRIIAQDV